MRESQFCNVLLRWYDANARDLPWRVPPADSKAGTRPDPYHVWLSEIMLQQTTVAAVQKYFLRFTKLWPNVRQLADARDERVMAEWAGLGYYARARNLLKCARIVAARPDGTFPDTHDELLRLPGIGPYTAAAISALAFGRNETVIDGNVERVMARYFAIRKTLDKAKPDIRRRAQSLTPTDRPGDYAQAMMDLGATVCTPRSPGCATCPIQSGCRAHQLGVAHELPRRKPKPRKPTRKGVVYLARRDDGAWLLERRPDSGLLGGMLGWPGSEWSDRFHHDPPLDADWEDPGAEVRHTFTHFHLRLLLQVASVPLDCSPERGVFMGLHEFAGSDLPTVMRKALDIAHAHLQGN